MTGNLPRHTLLIGLMALGAGLASPASAQVESPSADAAALNKGYALVATPSKRVQAELAVAIHAPALSAREWVVYAPRMPELPGQTDVRSALAPRGQPARELGPRRQPMLLARIPGDRPERRDGLDVRVQYQATLWARRLVRRPPGAPATPVPALDPEVRRAALARGEEFDFESEPFRRWLDDHELHRGPTEGEIDFARRVFLAIKEGFKYGYRDQMDRHASNVCRVGESDCGGMAIVFASALRANQVPARTLAGRWALSTREVGKTRFGQQHVKAEFFASGVGWVPADPSCAVVYDTSPEGIFFFGNDPGDFLTLHLDTHPILDTFYFGRESPAWLQGLCYWTVGSGSLDGTSERETWTVKVEPPLELQEAMFRKAVGRAGSQAKKGGQGGSR